MVIIPCFVMSKVNFKRVAAVTLEASSRCFLSKEQRAYYTVMVCDLSFLFTYNAVIMFLP